MKQKSIARIIDNLTEKLENEKEKYHENFGIKQVIKKQSDSIIIMDQ